MNGSAVNLREVYNNYYKYQGRSNFRKVEGLVMEGPFGKSQKLEDPQTPSSSDQGRSNGKIALGSKVSNFEPMYFTGFWDIYSPTSFGRPHPLQRPSPHDYALEKNLLTLA